MCSGAEASILDDPRCLAERNQTGNEAIAAASWFILGLFILFETAFESVAAEELRKARQDIAAMLVAKWRDAELKNSMSGLNRTSSAKTETKVLWSQQATID